LSEAVIARAARLSAKGADRAPEPVSIAVKAQREAATRMDRDLLLGLWHAQDLLAEVRESLLPEYLSEGPARELYAGWLEHGVGLPDGESGAARLARELAASGGEELNHEALVLGAAVALRRRWLEHRLRAIKLLTVQTKDPDALKKLQRENFELAKALSELRV